MILNSIKTINCRPIVRSQISDSNKSDLVIEEKLFTIQIAQIGSFTLLCTPENLKELAVGFLFSEGIITSIDDILVIDESGLGQLLIAFQVKNPEKVIGKRNLIVTSGCGLCGKDNLENLLVTIPACNNTLKFPPDKFIELLTQMQEQQVLFKQTGATHSAQLFDFKGKIFYMDEDVGRHNALDKVIGHCLLNRIPTQGCGLLLSCRVSFEMVVKAARAEIELIVAVSAPTALAIKAAKHWNITLCGFVREENGNIYSGIERLIKD